METTEQEEENKTDEISQNHCEILEKAWRNF